MASHQRCRKEWYSVFIVSFTTIILIFSIQVTDNDAKPLLAILKIQKTIKNISITITDYIIRPRKFYRSKLDGFKYNLHNIGYEQVLQGREDFINIFKTISYNNNFSLQIFKNINSLLFGYNLEDETVSGLSPVDRLKEYYYSGLSLEQAEAIIYFLEEASHKGGSISVMVNKAEELIRGGYTTAPDMITLEIEYIIQPGETLNSVASKFDTTVEKIVRRNKIADPDFIKAGDSIIVEAKMKVEYIDKSKTKTR